MTNEEMRQMPDHPTKLTLLRDEAELFDAIAAGQSVVMNKTTHKHMLSLFGKLLAFESVAGALGTSRPPYVIDDPSTKDTSAIGVIRDGQADTEEEKEGCEAG